nr:transmembrane 220 family protein [uncultured Arsenicibacter sp.]
MRKLTAIFFALIFLLFAAFQYNDPDPEVWIPIYLIGVGACILAYFKTGPIWLYGVIGLVYAVAAWQQWPPVFEGFLLDSMGMKTINIELARESGGLAICAVVIWALGWLVKNK